MTEEREGRGGKEKEGPDDILFPDTKAKHHLGNCLKAQDFLGEACAPSCSSWNLCGLWG